MAVLGGADQDRAALRGGVRLGGGRPPGSTSRSGGRLGRLGAARAQGLASSGDALPPRPGWYAYRVVTSADLPPWVVEVALTVERPLRPEPDAAGGHGWAAERPLRPEPEWMGGSTQAVLLLRAPGRAMFFTSIAKAAVEVEAALGVRPVTGPLLRMGHELPGLEPVAPAAALAHLGAAGMRGLAAPLRRRQPVVGWTEMSWRPSAGSVLTCDGPCGTSAQAVVCLRGLGNLSAIAPPPGGALVVRAWRARRRWGLACGLVLGAAEAFGLGREAGRGAANARAVGWDATVLSGSTALHLARAGNPSHPAPEAAGHAASGAQVAALVEACRAAGILDHPSAGPSRPWP
jgi:hypothetical protein